jgi:hypothetical protein
MLSTTDLTAIPTHSRVFDMVPGQPFDGQGFALHRIYGVPTHPGTPRKQGAGSGDRTLVFHLVSSRGNFKKLRTAGRSIKKILRLTMTKNLRNAMQMLLIPIAERRLLG